ncbi:efflux RND transporter permease subunit [Pleionea sp. CnH1-48]|uniref:efflux RND transporter permease subunit n=1 Tax=Pleionea sp. CnH1-48 TaxID=2954494 RepID=UPI0020981391|nr:efflux RND transporter permease subunit [Pleionea sp. CnH1-48]
MTSPQALSKFNQQRSFRIYGGIHSGTTTEAALSALEKAAAEILPEGYTIDYAGVSRPLRKEGNSLISVLLVSLCVVYLLLAIQFNSFRSPLVVLAGSVPLALSGALLFSFLSLTSINIYAQIGFITLVGLVAKNGILITEFANELQLKGRSKIIAIKEAAQVRLRPILMTTLATVIGHFPLVMVSGAGAEARNSIGIILVAGMFIGTLLTLFILPCVYLLLGENLEEKGQEDVAHNEIESSLQTVGINKVAEVA